MKQLFKRYDIVLVDFGDDIIDSEQGGIRPAVIVQNDTGNLFSSTTVVLPCTTKIKNINQPTHTLIKKGDDKGLISDSMVLAEAIRQVSTSQKRIKKYLGKITDVCERDEILRVKNAI